MDHAPHEHCHATSELLSYVQSRMWPLPLFPLLHPHISLNHSPANIAHIWPGKLHLYINNIVQAHIYKFEVASQKQININYESQVVLLVVGCQFEVRIGPGDQHITIVQLRQKISLMDNGLMLQGNFIFCLAFVKTGI